LPVDRDAVRARPLGVTVIPGDGIGPDVIGAARAVIDASGAPVAWDERQAGDATAQSYDLVSLPKLHPEVAGTVAMTHAVIERLPCR
jgi:isocitrate/isopropylmalate dehydrogenase